MKFFTKFYTGKFVNYVGVQFGRFKKPTARTTGISNRTLDCQFVLFLDYDYIFRDILELELGGLQQLFGLSDFYVMTSDEKEENGQVVGSYHAVCIDKFPVQELVEILQYPTCDWNFKVGASRDASHSWILRYMPKGEREAPKYLETIESPFFERKQSEAHANYLRETFGVEVRLRNGDGITDFLFNESYVTGSRIEKEEET